LGHNFGSRHARRSRKSSIDAGCRLVSKQSLSQNFGPLDWYPGHVKVGQKNKNTPFVSLFQANPSPKSKNFYFFFHRTKKTCCICRGFEQLSSYSGWRDITKKRRVNLLARAVVKGFGDKSHAFSRKPVVSKVTYAFSDVI